MTSSSQFNPTTIQSKVQLFYKGLSVLLSAAAVLVVGRGLYTHFHTHWMPQTVSTVNVKTLILDEVGHLSQLTSAKVSAKATVVLREDTKVGKFSLGNTNLVYEGVGEIQGGINLSALEATQVDMEHRRVHVILPPPQLTTVALNVNRSSVLANYRNWFGPAVELELQEKAQREALRQIRAKACAGPLLETTNENAKATVEHILATAGYQDIRVDTQLPAPGTCPTVTG